MTETDASLIAREMHALKASFSYRSLQHDIDLVFADLDRVMFAEASAAARPLYSIGADFVVDCYFEQGALEPLVRAYSGQPFRVSSRFDRLLTELERAGRFDLVERFWVSIARRTRGEYIYQCPRRDHGDHAGADEFKAYALTAYDQGIEWMGRLGRPETARLLTNEREALREERFGLEGPPTDPRPFSEALFWEFISTSRAGAGSVTEHLAGLAASLSGLGGPTIKRFGEHYAKLMKGLYHWNVWALAYAARGGCSDAAFEAFRSWLILQGDADLVKLAVSHPVEASRHVPRNVELAEDSGFWALEEAYLWRTGASLQLPSMEGARPKGKEWSEAEFEAAWPQLAARYTQASPAA